MIKRLADTYMLIALIALGRAWGPLFHQVVADEFAIEYLPHITDSQRTAFVSGSVFIDGLPKSNSHDIEWVIGMMGDYANGTDEWWFVMGLAMHIVVDVCGHYGVPVSFLAKGRMRHYFSELVVCATILKDRTPTPVERVRATDVVFGRSFGKSPFKFTLFCKLWRLVCWLPLDVFLGNMEGDACWVSGRDGYAVCNLEMHMRLIKCAMWDSMCRIMNGTLTEPLLGSIVLDQLQQVRCCR